MNSLRHGLRARTVVLPGESREEFNQLCDDLEREWQPQSRTAQFYLEQMAVSQWKLTRMEKAEAIIFRETLTDKTQLPLLDRLWQAQSRLERSYARAQRELERLQDRRPDVKPAPEHRVDPAASQSKPQPARPAPDAITPLVMRPADEPTPNLDRHIGQSMLSY